MKLLNFVIALSSSLTLTACSTTPTNPNTPIVLEQHKNIAVEPVMCAEKTGGFNLVN